MKEEAKRTKLEWSSTDIVPPQVRDVYPDGKADAWRIPTGEEMQRRRQELSQIGVPEDEDFERQHAETKAIINNYTLEWEDTNAHPIRVRPHYPNGVVGVWRTATWEENRQRLIKEQRVLSDPVAEAEAELDEIEKKEKLSDRSPLGSFEAALDTELETLRAVMMSRRRKYGHRNITSHGQVGIATRFADKAARIDALYFDEDGNPHSSGKIRAMDTHADESIDDTWIDAANYSIIALMLRHGTWTLPLTRGKQ